jgi:hypothetical protein
MPIAVKDKTPASAVINTFSAFYVRDSQDAVLKPLKQTVKQTLQSLDFWGLAL